MKLWSDMGENWRPKSLKKEIVASSNHIPHHRKSIHSTDWLSLKVNQKGNANIIIGGLLLEYEFRQERERDRTSLHSVYREQCLSFVSSFKTFPTLTKYYCTPISRLVLLINFWNKFTLKLTLSSDRGEITTGELSIGTCMGYILIKSNRRFQNKVYINSVHSLKYSSLFSAKTRHMC